MARDGTATRERILRVAQRLMTDQGYGATSVDQVIVESGSSKGAFFHHFSSKSDLALRLVERYVAADLAHLEAGLAATADIERPDGAGSWHSSASTRTTPTSSCPSSPGCLYATVLAEREFIGGDINDQVAKAERVWRDALADLLRPALAARRPALDVDVDALADHLFTTFEGGFILCRTLEDRSAMRAQLRIFRQLVEALLRVC